MGASGGRNRRRGSSYTRKAGAPNGHLPAETRQVAAAAEEAVERAKADNLSMQPRFAAGAKPDVFYGNVNRWLVMADLQEPSYSPDSRRRDTWLRNFWRLEPHLAGVMNSVVALDKNRGWSLTGGRNQIYRLTAILHAAESAPGLDGWRNFLSSQALSYYATDMGTICETGRDGPGGPLRALYHTDSARCRLTGIPDTPLEYTPSTTVGKRGGPQAWPMGSYFRVASMPSDDEQYNGLGFGAASRVLELAKLMVAVFRKDSESLGARMPDGLLLLQGIQQSQWEDALADREAKMSAKEREYFGGVFVLASAGIDQVDAKLLALKQLPENFNLQTFTDLLMFSYALAFGYSPREFWPVSSGSLGSGTESEMQDDNSSGKGESDFILNFQERLQDDMPETAWFEFDQRDSKNDLEQLGILSAKADFVSKMSNLSSNGQILLPIERIMELSVEQGLIPEDWAAVEGDMIADDTQGEELDRWRHMARNNPRVQRAIMRYPDEPIVRYNWPSGRTVTLWQNATDMQRRRAWPAARARVAESVRLSRSIERAAKALESAPAEMELDDMKATEFLERMQAIVGSGGAIQRGQQGGGAPLVIQQGADGQLRLIGAEPAPAPNVTVNIDTDGLGRSIAAALSNLPTPQVSITNQVPQAAAPTIEITNQVPAARPPEIRVDVPKQTVDVHLDAPVVNVTTPTPIVNIENVIEQGPERERAHFTVNYDSSGRPVSVDKTGTAS